MLPARIWLAATYALLPVAMGAVAAGRIGTLVAFVLLPLIGIAGGRMLAGPPRRARRAAWAAGLLVAVAAAFVPLIWPIAVVAAVGVIAAWPWPNLEEHSRSEARPFPLRVEPFVTFLPLDRDVPFSVPVGVDPSLWREIVGSVAMPEGTGRLVVVAEVSRQHNRTDRA